MERDKILELLRERIVAFTASRYRREQAEDVAQEVLQILHEKYSHVADLTELLPLSLKIARFRIMSGVRTEIRRGEHNPVPVDDLPLTDSRPNPAEQAERNQRLGRLHAALLTLGERCRQLIRYKLEGKTFPEIRILFHVSSINTIYTWDFRCRKQLLDALGGSWEARP